ncbi:hypothetical protein AMTRI_Chr01g134000 [Amborella trichopoda]
MATPVRGYGKISLSEPRPATPEHCTIRLGNPEPPCLSKKSKLILFSSLALLLLLGSGASFALLVRSRIRGREPEPEWKPSQAITVTCKKTLFPSLCVESLSEFPGAQTAQERDLVHISVNLTLHRVGKAFSAAALLNGLEMDTRVRGAYDDCIELLDDSMQELYDSLGVVSGSVKRASFADVSTWLSAALTNQDTCREGLEGVTGNVKEKMEMHLKDLSELISNCLAIFSANGGGDEFQGIPIQNKRRLMGAGESIFPSTKSGFQEKKGGFWGGKGGFPAWVTAGERRLLLASVAGVQADVVVDKSGNGTFKTISEAVKWAAEESSKRIIIYVKAGRYEENIKVGRKKTNLMFIGDGIGNTVVSGSRSVSDGFTTFHTATFAASGTGFIARDMTFENTAGPGKHQAVALRVGADHGVVYRCNIIGYQDTLYVHSQRQFFRECAIYGTVDFIFGNAAVVIQNCSLYARKPMPLQKNTITAQNRKDPNQNTGISIHNCRIYPTADLEPVKSSFPTYLGRPWKLYSRVVYMLSYMGDHIHPAGWLEWNATSPVNNLYYGEYMNYGPGGAVGQRVQWQGFHVITTVAEASRFTVAQFIYGSSWLPSTGVAFLAGLSV